MAWDWELDQWLGNLGRSGSAMPLRQFNRLDPGDVDQLLRRCLAVDRWVQTVAAARPYRRLDDLFEAARDAAFPFTPAELEAALATRDPPQLVPPARPYESRRDTLLRGQLAGAVTQYQHRFGRPFLIRTEGKAHTQILVELWERLGHDLDTEDRVLAQQVRETTLVTLARRITD